MPSLKNFALRLRAFTLALSLAALLSACGGGGEGAAGPSGAPGLPGQPGQSVISALVRISTESAGANCAAGGVRVQAGLDVNSSGVLDDGEVKETTFVCNGVAGAVGDDGAPGASSTGLLRTNLEPAGVNCASGGVRIQSGPDRNADDMLDDSEVRLTSYACNGTPGASAGTGSLAPVGPSGAPGTPGTLGSSGPAGTTAAIGTPGAPGASGTIGPAGPAGTPSTSGVTGTVAKAWQTAQLIETDNLGTAVNPQIAFDASGNAIAVWQQSDGTRFNIWANRFTPAAGWGAASLIETDNLGGAFNPQIALDGSGNALAVWQQLDGRNNNIWANRFTPAGGWDTAALIETNDLGSASVPQIAIDASGNAIAVWKQFDGIRFNIWAHRFAPEVGWSTKAPTLIETNNADASNPRIAFDGSGHAIAVWSQSDSTRSNIWANRYTPRFGWGTAARIETDNANTAENPQIAIDASGNAMAVWMKADGIRFNIWANRFTAADGWGSAALIEADAGSAGAPQIAMDASGNAIAVWQQLDSTRNNIWANRFTPAAGWGRAALIETDYAGTAVTPQIAFDAGGNAMAVWTQSDGTRNNIWVNRYTPAGGWGGAATIETDNVGNAFKPQIAVDGSGNALAVWQQLDSTRNNIWANRFR